MNLNDCITFFYQLKENSCTRDCIRDRFSTCVRRQRAPHLNLVFNNKEASTVLCSVVKPQEAVEHERSLGENTIRS